MRAFVNPLRRAATWRRGEKKKGVGGIQRRGESALKVR